MSREYNVFQRVAQDARNLQFGLHFIRENKNDLKLIWENNKKRNPSDKWYSRSFDEVLLGIVDSTIMAQSDLLASAIIHYLDPTEKKKLGFIPAGEELERQCPEFMLKYSNGRKAQHSALIFMDVRNKLTHSRNAPVYKFLKIKTPPIDILKKNVIVNNLSRTDEIFIRNENESYSNFIGRALGSKSVSPVPSFNNHTTFMRLSDLLFQDVIECVDLYEKRKKKPDAKRKRKIVLH